PNWPRSAEFRLASLRKLKNVTRPNRNLSQSAEIHEPFERQRKFFDNNQPIGNLIEERVVKNSLRLPCNEFVFRIEAQMGWTGQTSGTRSRRTLERSFHGESVNKCC